MSAHFKGNAGDASLLSRPVFVALPPSHVPLPTYQYKDPHNIITGILWGWSHSQIGVSSPDPGFSSFCCSSKKRRRRQLSGAEDESGWWGWVGVRTITNVAPILNPSRQPTQILRSLQIHLNWYRPAQNRFLLPHYCSSKYQTIYRLTKKLKHVTMAQI